MAQISLALKCTFGVLRTFWNFLQEIDDSKVRTSEYFVVLFNVSTSLQHVKEVNSKCFLLPSGPEDF
ncbi:hypothetical protein HUJ05_012853 [Dendroctonus ponderosae]|nr:hypothetical protein HUJ05_012853 [Dendroctonus ponderosae]